MKKLCFGALIALLFGACSENYVESESLCDLYPTIPEYLVAAFESPVSRTYVENGKSLRWTKDDEISYFPAVAFNMQYRYEGESGANNASFTRITAGPVAGTALGCNYAVYPYSSATTISDEGVISCYLSSKQSYAENSFGVRANTMVCATKDRSDEVLRFQNVGGYLKLQLYGEDVTVKQIVLRGNNNEKIAGSATITATYGNDPVMLMADNAKTNLTLDCNEGVTLSADLEHPTAFWFVLPVVNFEKGFTITVIDTQGGFFEQSTANAISIERNMIQPMKRLEVAVVGHETPETQKIRYVAREKIIPSATDVFGANIVSNEWDEVSGNGVIIFDGEVTTIGEGAFAECRIQQITLPEGISAIGKQAFYQCIGLQSVQLPEGVSSIGEGAFYFTGLRSIDLPESLTSIGPSAFASCSRLTDVTLPQGVVTIESDTFNDCSKLVSVTMPNGLQSIGQRAFCHCSSLVDITLPNSLTVIEAMAFDGCSSLRSLLIPDGVVSIGKCAFCDCSSLEHLVFPPQITVLEDLVCDGCSSLLSVEIPQGVTVIGEQAFDECVMLEQLTIPDTVVSIGDNAFRGCSGLQLTTIGTGIEAIGSGAFEECTGGLVVKSDIPGSIYYGDGAFVGSKFTKVTIADNVTKIGGSAFRGCSTLQHIIIGKEVYSVGVRAFEECGGKLTIYANQLLEYDHSSTYYAGSSIARLLDETAFAEIEIGDNITKIGDYTFYKYDSPARVTISDQVASIGAYAFSGSAITRVVVGDGVTLIDQGAFEDCTSLTTVHLGDQISMIGPAAFKGCSNLTDINIPSKTTSIGGGTFEGCSKLPTITLPEGLLKIGSDAFYKCTSLTSIAIPDSVTSLGEWAFCGCTSLAAVSIGNGVSSIRAWTFASCSKLEKIVIPNYVEWIGEKAFYDCINLVEVWCMPTTPPNGDFQMFGNNAANRKIYVPEASLSAYQAALDWKDYTDALVCYTME